MMELMSGAMIDKRGVIPAKITGIRFVFLEPGVNTGNVSSGYIGVYSIELHNQGVYYSNTLVEATASSEYNSNYSANLAIAYTNNMASGYWCTTSANNGNPDRSCWLQITFPERPVTGFDIYFHNVYQCKNFDVEVRLPNGTWVYALTIRRSTVWPNITKTPLRTYLKSSPSSSRQCSWEFDRKGLNLPLNLGLGPTKLIGYYIDPENPFRQHGFFGEVASSEFITGDVLASNVGLGSAGTAHNNDTSWLKFLIDGKIVFVPKLTLRYNITWRQIYQAGCVYADDTTGKYPSGTPVLQNKRVTIQGYQFKVGLLSGANVDPHPDTNGYDLVTTHGCEWNRLFYNICVNNPNYPQTSQEGPDWWDYTDVALGFTTGNGSYNWCRESHALVSDRRVYRGYNAVTFLNKTLDWSAGISLGWRPKLELYNLHG